MDREKANELYAKAFYSSKNNEWIIEFARLVELETLERAARAISAFHGREGDFDNENDRMYYNRAINDSLNAVRSTKETP